LTATRLSRARGLGQARSGMSTITTILNAELTEQLLTELQASKTPSETAMGQLAELTASERTALRKIHAHLDAARFASPSQSCTVSLSCEDGIVSMEFPPLTGSSQKPCEPASAVFAVMPSPSRNRQQEAPWQMVMSLPPFARETAPGSLLHSAPVEPSAITSTVFASPAHNRLRVNNPWTPLSPPPRHRETVPHSPGTPMTPGLSQTCEGSSARPVCTNAKGEDVPCTRRAKRMRSGDMVYPSPARFTGDFMRSIEGESDCHHLLRD